ncbi:MAG TPA: hypothetical protein VEV17_09495 [Bryobacteraceae bacterium]|nr:hypothetical protein [Bryobacteraceae bacterium]
MSDLARSAVQRLIADGNRQREDEELADKMYRLERLIAAVTEQLQMLRNGNAQDASPEVRETAATSYANSAQHNGRGDN